jgi:hypothetical protein
VIAVCSAILLVVSARIENGTCIGIITETSANRQGLVAFWCPSWFRTN